MLAKTDSVSVIKFKSALTSIEKKCLSPFPLKGREKQKKLLKWGFFAIENVWFNYIIPVLNIRKLKYFDRTTTRISFMQLLYL
jgi:hypothetical protein